MPSLSESDFGESDQYFQVLKNIYQRAQQDTLELLNSSKDNSEENERKEEKAETERLFGL